MILVFVVLLDSNKTKCPPFLGGFFLFFKGVLNHGIPFDNNKSYRPEAVKVKQGSAFSPAKYMKN